ncbi:MAG: site-specific integrase [Lachnospiraceae bacterium]|nr:site-specific integrase [Lachnospiraceae bacterium]
MGKRGENIRMRADGRWEARIVVGKNAAGRTEYKYLYGRTYQEVRKRKMEFLLTQFVPKEPITEQHPVNSEHARVTNTPAKDEAEEAQISFREAACGWLDAKKPTVKESSFSYYTIMLNNFLLPAFGDRPLKKLTSQELTAYFLSLKERERRKDGKSLALKTIGDLRTILVQILYYAKEQGMIRDVPSCPSISRKQPAIRVLSLKEQRLIEREALKEDTTFTLGVLLSLYGGLRIGEVCALKWENFDFQNGTVRIEKTASRIANIVNGKPAGTKIVVGSPKTDCSLRTIPLPEAVLSYFLDRRRSNADYLLTGTEKMMEPRAWLARFIGFLRRAGVGGCTWHCRRHTFATRCVENGVDTKSLSEIMGHSDVKITLQRYVHPSMETKREQINKLSCFSDSGQK